MCVRGELKRGRVMAEKHIHLLIPVVLILLAGFLASNPDILTKPQPSSFGLVRQAHTEITGLAIVNTTSCDSDDILFQATNTENAHLCQPGLDALAAPYAACPFTNIGTGNPSDYTCSTACATNPTSPLCNAIVKLSSSAFPCTHAEQKDIVSNGTTLCFKGINCEYVNFPSTCASVNATCIATISNATNAHLADCAGQAYPIQICCKQTAGLGSPDTDGDGVPDDGDNSGLTTDTPCATNHVSNCDDNCYQRPNGPVKGSCLIDPTTACTADADCATGSCDLSQQDTDGDHAGDVCDADPTNSCTILIPGDNCPGTSVLNCTASSLHAAWSATSAQEGSSVPVHVTGAANCNTLAFQFNVFNTQDPTIATLDPQPATMTLGSASSTWTAEYHLSASSNAYEFQARAVVNGSAITVSSANTLITTRHAGATCGNGIIEGSNNETCDDGNTNNHDGCSSNCTPEGIYGQQCSNACPVDGLGICDSPSRIKLCGNYDADPCLELSTPQNCASGTTCSSSYGDAECMPPACKDAFTCTIGECTNGFKQRSCTNTASVACHAYNPTIQIPCIKLEEPAQLPAFTLVNIILTILLIALYYNLRRRS